MRRSDQGWLRAFATARAADRKPKPTGNMSSYITIWRPWPSGARAASARPTEDRGRAIPVLASRKVNVRGRVSRPTLNPSE